MLKAVDLYAYRQIVSEETISVRHCATLLEEIKVYLFKSNDKGRKTIF